MKKLLCLLILLCIVKVEDIQAMKSSLSWRKSSSKQDSKVVNIESGGLTTQNRLNEALPIVDTMNESGGLTTQNRLQNALRVKKLPESLKIALEEHIGAKFDEPAFVERDQADQQSQSSSEQAPQKIQSTAQSRPQPINVGEFSNGIKLLVDQIDQGGLVQPKIIVKKDYQTIEFLPRQDKDYVYNHFGEGFTSRTIDTGSLPVSRHFNAQGQQTLSSKLNAFFAQNVKTAQQIQQLPESPQKDAAIENMTEKAVDQAELASEQLDNQAIRLSTRPTSGQLAAVHENRMKKKTILSVETKSKIIQNWIALAKVGWAKAGVKFSEFASWSKSLFIRVQSEKLKIRTEVQNGKLDVQQDDVAQEKLPVKLPEEQINEDIAAFLRQQTVDSTKTKISQFSNKTVEKMFNSLRTYP